MLHCLIKKIPVVSFGLKRYLSSQSVTLDDVSCFGSLLIRCPSVSMSIKSINPHEVPNGDRAIVYLKNSDMDISAYFSILYNQATSVLAINERKLKDIDGNNISLCVQIPHNYNIDASAYDVDIKEIEGDELIVLSRSHCAFKKIKFLNNNITVSEGDLKCEAIQGNGHVSVHRDVNIGKIQTQNIFIESGRDINICDVYCETVQCKTTSGSINIKNLHGCSTVCTDSGSVMISSSVGNLDVSTTDGHINVNIENCDHAKIKSETGDVFIGLSDSVSAYIEAEASVIDIPEYLLFDGLKRHSSNGSQYFEGKCGDGKSEISVVTSSGEIKFSRKNWFSNFQLED